ncbi:hypothetical protein PG990_010377 [Apiospora arundinis]
MFSRLSQVARHLSRPQPNLGHTSAAAASRSSGLASRIMATTTAEERNTRTIHTAACLIIGDEVLGGKTVDTNSAYMAKWCFKLGMNLKRVEVIEDDEDEIMEAVKRMSDRYDFVVTSGGIGPTHDDITYQSIAKAFDLKLILHEEAYERMKKLTNPANKSPTSAGTSNRPKRLLVCGWFGCRLMNRATWPNRHCSPKTTFGFPYRSSTATSISCPEFLVSVIERLLEGLKPSIVNRLVDPQGKGITRVIISTPKAESAVATYLTELAEKVAPKGVKVGSYPRWGKANNSVTLVGRDKEYLESLVPEVLAAVDGKRVEIEKENDEP